MSNKKQHPLLKKTEESKAGQSFGDVAALPNLGGMPKKHMGVDNNIAVNKEVNVEDELDFDSAVDHVPNFNKTPKKRQVTVYVDEDIAVKLDKLHAEKGKGAKSEFANMLFKKALQNKYN